MYESVCEVIEGESKCVTGVATLFYACMEIVETGPFAGQPINERDMLPLLGKKVDESCMGVLLRVLVVPGFRVVNNEHEAALS